MGAGFCFNPRACVCPTSQTPTFQFRSQTRVKITNSRKTSTAHNSHKINFYPDANYNIAYEGCKIKDRMKFLIKLIKEIFRIY